MRRHTRAAAFAAPLILFALALGACGADPDRRADAAGGGDAAATSDHDKQLAFARCMRENGVDMPDPEPPKEGAVAAGRPIDSNSPEFTGALEACRSLLPNGGQPRPLSPEQRQKQLEFAKCMRENGIEDYPDPPADGAVGGRYNLPNPDDAGYEAAMARFRAAGEKCGLPEGAAPAEPAR
ncbi:hypothetical protein AB0M79_04200 [Polymorphospora sp. NPDC051019]|uniref:hypothetical protein n=1 Tax=Polymorphospora sp. NPDC051019 TaxID=3155725 RepID=UPI00343830A9